MTIIPSAEVQRLQNALPFWLSLGMIPVAVLASAVGRLGGAGAAALCVGDVLAAGCGDRAQ